MYRKHFALTQHPFGPEIAPEDLFPSATSRELDTRLAHLLDLRGIGLITGDSGSGKTCACRKVLTQLHTGLYRVIYVSLSTGNVMDLYKTISWEMGLAVERSRAALYRQIKSEVSRLCTDARCRPILVVDEAHHLRPDVLEDLRLLTNYQMDAENRLCLVLVGHPELRRRLTMAVHEALAQRIVVRHHMAALTREELTAYLAHRLRLAGAELPLFDPAAEEALFQATSGLPRKINLLAHHTLIAAALARAKLATADHVQAALPEVAYPIRSAPGEPPKPCDPGAGDAPAPSTSCPRDRAHRRCPTPTGPRPQHSRRTILRTALTGFSKKREEPSAD